MLWVRPHDDGKGHCLLPLVDHHGIPSVALVFCRPSLATRMNFEINIDPVLILGELIVEVAA